MNFTPDLKRDILILAERLGCLDDIADLSDIQAIRYLQRKEGHTPCYAADKPLSVASRQPWSSSPLDDCTVLDCTWKNACNIYRLPNPLAHHSGTASRDDILTQADRFDCRDEVKDLPEIAAIRAIQLHGGYSPCYATDSCPIAAYGRANECLWAQPCSAYRSMQVIPIGRELDDASLDALETFRRRIGELLTRLENPADRTVGMQLGSLNQLLPATRKMLVVSPHTVVGEIPNLACLKPYLISDTSQIVHGDSGGYTFEYSMDVLLTGAIRPLQDWLVQAKPFFDAGQLDYFPLIQHVHELKHISRGGIYSAGAIPSFWKPDASIALDTFQAPYLGVPSGEILLTRSEFAPILNLTLPVLENIDLAMLHRLMEDHPVELTTFRDFLMDRMEDTTHAAVGSEQFGRELNHLERDLRDRLRKLDSDFRSARLKAAFELVGCAVGAWTLAIFCVLHGEGDLLTVLGPGGVAITASAAMSQYLVEKMKIKDDPVAFLWEIGRTERK